MFCYDSLSVAIFKTLHFGVYSAEVPVMVYYSHVPAFLITLFISLFILLNSRTLPARILMVIALAFATLSISDILLWTQIDSRYIMFFWSFWLFLFTTIYVLSFYFIYTFINKKDAPFTAKLLGAAIIIGVLVLSASHYNLESFDLYNCTAIERLPTLNAVFGLSFLIFLSVLGYGLRKGFARKRGEGRRETLLATIGISLFLFAFSAAAYTASIANILGSAPDTFLIEQYGYFGMTIFIAFLTYIIVEYRAFNIGLIGAQALVGALIAVLASEYAFVHSKTNMVLVSVTLVLTGVVGTILIRSVRREIEQRIHIEKLARDLQIANENQVTLIHFITHQIKGFVTKSRNIFAGLLEGDYGQLPDTMRPLIEEGFRSDTKGTATIQEILNASNIKSGKVTYKMEPFDLKTLIDETAKDLKPTADAKKIAFVVDTGTAPLTFTGDRGQLVNAFKNLIDNSIKYTPTGTVTVSLKKEEGKIVFKVEDTGVGITAEDMKNLFTEGGHGKESTKVNVESTGFGLYIVRNIVEAHKGKVWAESDGAGKGSRFIAEFPE
jgi:signal transduction histidine kinase